MTTSSDLTAQTLAELGGRVRSREVSPVEVVQAFVERTDALEPKLGAYITRMSEQALTDAKAAESEIGAGNYRGPLHGLPVAVKDIYWTAGVRTTSGSVINADFVPDRDATAVRLLRDAGAVPIGKTNTVEFAFDPTGRNAHYGMPHNPWGLDRMPGGSSSGSGVAVAAGLAPLALGTDTGGSVRIPAALCGITGLKPTFGLVGRSGVTPLAYSLDTVGPMTRTAEDAALALNVLAGHDPDDPGSIASRRRDYTRGLNDGVRGMRIGVPKEFVWEVMDPDVQAAFHKAMAVFNELGADVDEVSIPEIAWTAPISSAIASAEAAVVHGDAVLEKGDLFDQSVRRRIETGFFVPAAAYIRAQRARVLLARRMAGALTTYDLIAMPTVPMPAPKQGVETMEIGGVETSPREALIRITRVFNVARLPAVSVPCGFSPEGLPLAFQLGGPPFEDGRVLRAAHAYQGATGWHTKRPALGP